MSRIYLITTLPQLDVNSPLEITRQELDFLIEQNLSSKEKALIDIIREGADILNAARWFEGREFSHIGTISPQEYSIALAQEDDKVLSKTIVDFIERYPAPEERKKNASSLLFSYFSSILYQPNEETINTTVRAICEMEHYSRLIFAHLRNQEGKEKEDSEGLQSTFLSREELERIPFSLESLDEWQEEYKPLYEIWSHNKDKPKELEAAFTEWKFRFLSELLSPLNHFGIDHILVYCAQFDLLAARSAMNKVSYESVIERISKAR